MNIKKTLGLCFISFIAGGTAYVAVRKNQLEKVIDKLKVSIADIQNFKLSAGSLKADVFLNINNPTNIDLTLNTGLLKAKKLKVHEKGTNKVLAVSEINTNDFKILAGDTYKTPAIAIEIPLITGAILALNQITNNKKDFISNLTFDLEVSILKYSKSIKF